MKITVLAGAAAFSDFRTRALNTRLRGLGLELLDSCWLYLAAWHERQADNADAFAQLVEGRPLPAPTADDVLILPRLGTISPWSSKATDIAGLCGLQAIARLERGRRLHLAGWTALSVDSRAQAARLLHDPLTESLLVGDAAVDACFAQPQPRALRRIEFGADPAQALAQANRELGLALSDGEIDYLLAHYVTAGRAPTDAELMMFAQINSEHCRHKIFNARWTLDSEPFEHSLFDMIRMSHAARPQGVLSAYSDNAAILAAQSTTRFITGPDQLYTPLNEPAAIAIKVETHNHPTGIAPDPGAATGAGGEIRDEAATGRGGKPKAGLCGFTVSDLRIPGYEQPWEHSGPWPGRLSSALDIMLEGPIGAASYNNEFGRPNISGYFRTLDVEWAGRRWGYGKPIMIAGGLGNVRPAHALKNRVAPGDSIVVLGGPGMLIGLGGGAASSMHAGASDEDLDFASVQRANPELERRCQEVIDQCWMLGDENPIVSIHDVGAGGLSNAVPEILDDNELGGDIALDEIPCADPSMSPMERWCNESQERYVIAIRSEDVERFAELCARERCPHAVIGTATAERRLLLRGPGADNTVDMPMPVLLGKLPPMQRSADLYSVASGRDAVDNFEPPLREALDRVLRLPAVASKNFLITIGDRTVSGLVCRDQMVGPWQVPVADVGVTAAGYAGVNGEAMAMGERTPLAVFDAPASGRMAVAEAVTNIAAARIEHLTDVRLSANWMAAASAAGQDDALLATVQATGAQLCSELGLAIPVGKDSMSMQTRWTDPDGHTHDQTSPLSLIISAFAPVADIRRTLTPQLRIDESCGSLVLIDLGRGRNRLGASALAQVYNKELGPVPDLDDADQLRRFFEQIQALASEQRILAYHDRSDGGLITTLLEMAFAGHCGLDIELDPYHATPMLFAEEPGAVIQVADSELGAILTQLSDAGLEAHFVGRPTLQQQIRIRAGGRELCSAGRVELHQAWAETSYRMQALRDDPECAAQEFDALLDEDDPGLQLSLAFAPDDDITAPYVGAARPRIAILREQGVNGQVEMAWMFHQAGFESVDVHMSQILSGEVSLDGFSGLAACGGFSYGDVLGAGRGWARTILMNQRARAEFEAFLGNPERFALGVCNGCQMLAALRELIPGSAHWPLFVRNRSEQFEARLSQLEIGDSPSVFLTGMAGSRIPVAVAHGEGRAEFAGPDDASRLADQRKIAMRFVDNRGLVTERFPANPNGSPDGITGLCNDDGRVTIMMPHPERLTRAASFSWWPNDMDQDSPWLRMFRNARVWVG